MRRLGSILGRLGLVLATVLVTALLLELAVRWLGPPFHPRSLDDKRLFTRYDPELGWANRPFVTGGFVGAGYAHGVQHSSIGLRDTEHAVAREPGRRRVLVLGDSMVWGLGVHDHQIFPRLLAERLARTEVIAMGTSGYGTDQELLWFTRDGARFRPDVVVLALYPANDLRDILGTRRYSRNKPRFVLGPDGALRLEGGAPVPERRRGALERAANAVMDPLRQHSALYHLVEGRRRRLHERFRHRGWYRTWFGDMPGGDWTDMYRARGGPPPWLGGALDLAEALVLELRRRVQAAGGTLTVLLLPHAVTVEPGAWPNWLDAVGLDPATHDPDTTRRRLRQRLDAKGIVVLDPAVAMRKAGGRHYLPEDEHLNPAGHALIADFLAFHLGPELERIAPQAAPEAPADPSPQPPPRGDCRKTKFFDQSTRKTPTIFSRGLGGGVSEPPSGRASAGARWRPGRTRAARRRSAARSAARTRRGRPAPPPP